MQHRRARSDFCLLLGHALYGLHSSINSIYCLFGPMFFCGTGCMRSLRTKFTHHRSSSARPSPSGRELSFVRYSTHCSMPSHCLPHAHACRCTSQREQLRPRHHDVALALNGLAECYLSAGQLQVAAAVLHAAFLSLATCDTIALHSGSIVGDGYLGMAIEDWSAGRAVVGLVQSRYHRAVWSKAQFATQSM